jgi:small subunit ribosomal protein S4e
VTAVAGQHAGQIGEIEAIDVTLGSGDNTVTVASEDGGYETVEEYVVVIDENFTDDEGDADE